MNKHRLLVPLAAGMLLCAFGPLATHARADDDKGASKFTDIAIAVDLDYATAIESFGASGAGFGIRTGLQLHVPFVVLTPEIGFTHHRFGGDGEPSISRGILGMRAAIGEIFRLGAFGHIAYASLDAEPPYSLEARSGLSYDLGIFFDFTLLPLFDIGVHAAYNQVTADGALDAFHFVTAGAHVALIL